MDGIICLQSKISVDLVVKSAFLPTYILCAHMQDIVEGRDKNLKIIGAHNYLNEGEVQVTIVLKRG